MATLQKIRNRAGVLVAVVIGAALLAFIAGDLLKSGGSLLTSSRNEVAEIAGESVSIRDFQNRVNHTVEINKMMTGQSALSSEQLDRLREQVWQQLVQEIVMTQEYDELGISISPEELFDMVQGKNIDPMIRQMFQDENGQVDSKKIVATLKNLIEAPAGTPQKAYWLNIEEALKTQRALTKYNTLIQKGLYIPSAYAQNISEANSKKVDFSYVVKKYSDIADSTIQVSGSEVKSYYEDHKELFKQTESRKIEYITFDVDPSADDYQYTEKWINDLKADFIAAENNAQFVELNSDTKFNGFFQKDGEILNKELNDFMFKAKKGDLYGPYFENETYKIAKLNDVKMLPDSVKARHILIRPINGDIKKAEAKADSIKNLLSKGAKFAAMAKQFSDDQGSAVNGGDLGWFGAKRMVKPFSDAAFNSKKNEIKVVLTQFGAHVIQVTKKSKAVKKVQVAIVDRKVEPSQKTFQKIYAEARKFAGNNQTREAFDKAIETENLTKRVANLRKNSQNVAGLENSRELIRAAYQTDDKENILVNSEEAGVFEFGTKFVVAVLADIKEEGYADVQDVKNIIAREIRKDKKADIISKELTGNMKGSQSLLSVAQKENLEVKDASNISFQSFQIPGAGIEPNVIASSALLEKGKISEPIKGNQGVYVILVNNVTKNELKKEDVANFKNRLEQGYQYRTNYQAFQALKENANVVDKRYKFY
jgi:peptidyl-prolyl cis-trans isomerase D